MAITNDSTYIALGDSDKLITVFPYQQLENEIKRNTNPFNPEESSRGNFHLYPHAGNIAKLTLDYHNDSVNALTFTKRNKYFLISGSSDKVMMIWKIKEDFTSEKIRILKNQSDINDIQITPNDEFIFSGCIDNNIYVWRSNFSTNTFELVNCINNIHSNFITSICLDPNLERIAYTEMTSYIMNNGIKFASYSDDGKLVIAETLLSQNGFRNNVIKEFKEFINVKNKINSIQKKIELVNFYVYNCFFICVKFFYLKFSYSWSSDGNWIVSVNHHYIKNHKVVHARLVNMNDVNNSQVLIGHESAVLVAVKNNLNIFKYF
jgi:WD40 repeat protein